ncbi:MULTISPECIES: amidohydrolase [Glycomyces]|uniref:Amidohydrolase n=2 Tax=Glycomyces TaxID=58113 RepID=A0A9X3PQ88_9ACTN|nr:amidohydrolase [Glycomyces lechevalierae]MDA1387247.1 amidohydrolase [Glycomyces lechevalierae]MDR7338489.1 imidazolonepropionase-like amidohydrolase [Glycomyces lechevalierae]
MSEATFALRGARVVPITSAPIDNGVIIVEHGRISAVGGADLPVPEGVPVEDATGKWIVPGLIDAHTHLGVHEVAEGWAGNDTNEMTDPNTAYVRALDGINPAEPGFAEALQGGVLAVNVNPGSGNVIGGETVAIKTVGRYVDEMVLRSPSGVKSALGENPKRVYGEQKKTPSTRLGTAGVLRQAFVEAENYRSADAPDRDLKLEVLAKVLDREIPWRQHCHRADDIATALRVAEEFGYDLVLDHGTEAHLLADVVAERGIPVIFGPLLCSRSKVETVNRWPENAAKLAAAGVKVAITTDHPVVPIEHLIIQVMLAVKAGLDRDTALRSVTINPAQIMGVDDRLGSLEAGKDADFCIWSGDPLDIYSKVERAYIDGAQVG